MIPARWRPTCKVLVAATFVASFACLRIFQGSETECHRTERKSYARIPDVLALPDLIEIQLDSYKWFQHDGLRELFDEVSPFRASTGTLSFTFPA